MAAVVLLFGKFAAVVFTLRQIVQCKTSLSLGSVYKHISFHLGIDAPGTALEMLRCTLEQMDGQRVRGPRHLHACEFLKESQSELLLHPGAPKHLFANLEQSPYQTFRHASILKRFVALSCPE